MSKIEIAWLCDHNRCEGCHPQPDNKCVTCGHSINATTMDDSEPVYICGSMNECTYEEE